MRYAIIWPCCLISSKINARRRDQQKETQSTPLVVLTFNTQQNQVAYKSSVRLFIAIQAPGFDPDPNKPEPQTHPYTSTKPHPSTLLDHHITAWAAPIRSMAKSTNDPNKILEDHPNIIQYYTISTRVVKKPCINRIAHCEDPYHTAACNEHWKLLEERLCPCCVCVLNEGYMYESVRELQLRTTARNEPRLKTEELRNGKAGGKEADREENTKV